MSDERRGNAKQDSGRRRRETDRRNDFNLLRDRVLLGIGGAMVLAVSAAAIFFPIRNPEVALAALTLGGALLGVPSVLRLDEARRERDR